MLFRAHAGKQEALSFNAMDGEYLGLGARLCSLLSCLQCSIVLRDALLSLSSLLQNLLLHQHMAFCCASMEQMRSHGIALEHFKTCRMYSIMAHSL